MNLLIVEDSKALRETLHDGLAKLGYGVDAVGDGKEGLDYARLKEYDVILLDLMLPGMDGLSVLRELRAGGKKTHVLILSAKDQVEDRVRGLHLGADDYMIKPFDLSELSSRLNAVARRYSGNPNPLIEIGDLRIDLAARTVMHGARPVELTGREWALFEAFLQRPGIAMTKAQLEDRLYAFGAEVESNTIEVHVSRLRKKLGHGAIDTVRGIGYRLGTAR